MFKFSCANHDLDCCENIMQQIYNETPSFWPYGLSRQHFDGGLWLVKKASDEQPVGFVGWQLRREDGLKVGYYSVGILPEWRQHGLAKEAVTKLLAKQASAVDIVRALIDHRNEPSRNLAAALESPKPLEVKLASLSPAAVPAVSKALSKSQLAAFLLGRLASAGTGATVNAVGWDQYMNPDKRFSESLPWNLDADKQRGMMYGLNAILGALGGFGIHQGLSMTKAHPVLGPAASSAGLSTILMSPVKDLVATSTPMPGKILRLLNSLQTRVDTPAAPTISPNVLMALGGAGALGLGGLALAGMRGSSALSDAASRGSGGRIRVTLPTKNPGDAETQVEMPMEDVQLSENLYRALGRDTRRRLRSESGERKRKFLGEQQRAKNLGVNIDDAGRIVNEPINQPLNQTIDI